MPMREAVEKHCLDQAYWKDLIITQPQLGEEVSIIGAGALVSTKGGVGKISDVIHKLDN